MKRTLYDEIYRIKKGRYPSRFHKIMMNTRLYFLVYFDMYLVILICLLLLLLVISVCK